MDRGRPTDYKEEYCQEIIDFMAQGYSVEAFAGHIGVSKESVYEWARVHKNFSDSKKIAITKCQMFWEKLAIDNPFTDAKRGGLNSGVWVFNMKNRFKWTDRTEIEAGEKTQELIKLKYSVDE